MSYLKKIEAKLLPGFRDNAGGPEMGEVPDKKIKKFVNQAIMKYLAAESKNIIEDIKDELHIRGGEYDDWQEEYDDQIGDVISKYTKELSKLLKAQEKSQK